MASQRQFFVGGNWKMNGSKDSIDGIIQFLNAGPLDPKTGEFYVLITMQSVYVMQTFLAFLVRNVPFFQY